jgi:cwf18 pre-mRNA splicing factor
MEEAKARRERLKALKEAALLVEGGTDGDAATAVKGSSAEAQPPGEPPVLKFRNYVPRDEKISHEKVCGGRSHAG